MRRYRERTYKGKRTQTWKNGLAITQVTVRSVCLLRLKIAVYRLLHTLTERLASASSLLASKLAFLEFSTAVRRISIYFGVQGFLYHLLNQILNWHVAILNLPVFRRSKLELGSVKNILSIFPPYERNKQSWHQRAVTNEIGYLQGRKQDMLEML